MKALVLNCSPVKNGATAKIAKLVGDALTARFEVTQTCIADYEFAFCKGCRSCHKTATCVQQDGAQKLVAAFDGADVIVCVSPSYWADVPGQFKAFIDRCTPWCNTHTPYAKLRAADAKKGYAVVLRTGPNAAECSRLIGTIEHFYGHMEIPCCGAIGFTSVENTSDVDAHKTELADFCAKIG